MSFRFVAFSIHVAEHHVRYQQTICVQVTQGRAMTSRSCGYRNNMAAGRVLVYGGKGALGSVIVSHLKAKNWVSI